MLMNYVFTLDSVFIGEGNGVTQLDTTEAT